MWPSGLGYSQHQVNAPVTAPAPPAAGPLPGAPSPWRTRGIALLEVLACSSLPTQILIQNVVVLAGMNPWRSPGVPTLTFLATTQLADSIVLIGLMVVLTRAHGERPVDIWRGQAKPAPEARLGLKLIPVVFLSMAVTMGLLARLAPGLHNVTENPFEQLLDTPAHAAVMLLVVIVAGGLREELQRAFLLRRFERHLGGAPVGVVLLSLAFGAGHYMQGWDAVIATSLIGAFWAVVYLRRRSVVAPVVSHAGFDVFEIVRASLS